jgi:hypothetical protein
MKNVKSMEMDLMKSRALTILFSMLIAALLLLPLMSSAKGREKTKSNAKVYMHPLNKECHAAITITSVEEGKFTLTVESENGASVYYNEVMNSPEQFSKVFDFSNLRDGEYTLKLKSKYETKETQFDIVGGKIKVFNAEKEVPVFKTSGEKAEILVPNASNLNYSISIVNENGEELYSTYESKENIKKVFDFSKLEKGKYQILASTSKTSYAFGFEKKNQ